jgi:hypothetical protein
MEIVKDLVESVPCGVLILLVLLIVGLFVLLSSVRKHAVGVDEGEFKARPFLLFVLGAMAMVCLWPFVFGLGETAKLSDGLDAFVLLTVLPRLLFFSIAAFFGFAIFILRRSYVRVTTDQVEYFDGWRKRVRISRSDILSAEVRHPGAMLVVRCVNEKDNFTVPLIAYSRAGLLVALLKRSAMRI